MNILITGISTGIGRELALSYLKEQQHCILLSRPDIATECMLSQISGTSFEYFPCDLSEPTEVISVCNELKNRYSSIDVLINNAGVYLPTRSCNSTGLEMTFAVNVLAPFLLITNLSPLLKQSVNAQIINISSIGERYAKVNWDDLMADKHYEANLVYNNSKQLLAMLSCFFADSLKAHNILVNALHPGGTNSGLISKTAVDKMPWALKIVYRIARRFNRSAAATANDIQLFISKNRVNKWTGCFVSKGKIMQPSNDVLSKNYQERIIKVCQELALQY